MRNFFRRLRESFSNSKKARETRNKKMREAKAELDKGNVTPRTGFDAVRADVAMDFGAAEKDTEYFSRLGKRQERSQQALADMRDKRRKRNDEKADDTTDTTTNTTNTTETTTADDDTDNTTTLDTDTDTALTNLENISNQTFDNTDNISNYFDDTATSVATAAGQEQNQASALTTSVGEAEDDAISMMTTGTLSNIKTTPQGLLTDEEDDEDLFRKRRTLIGA